MKMTAFAVIFVFMIKFGYSVPRRNVKSEVLGMRELQGLFNLTAWSKMVYRSTKFVIFRDRPMNEVIKTAIKHMKNKEYENVLECVKKLNPYEFKEFMDELISIDDDGEMLEGMGKTLSYEKMHEFHELGSSKREREFIMNKSKNGELNDSDYFNLRACDF